MSTSFIPLMAVQCRPRSNIYAMPVREFATSAEATAASLAARARLRRPTLAIAPPVPATAPAKYVPDENVPYGAPLNMLQLCSGSFLIALAALRHSLPVAVILGQGHARNIVRARYDAMALVYRHTQYSMPRVGRLFDRDHTTVLHALRKLGVSGKLVDKDPLSDKPRDEIGKFVGKPKPSETVLQMAVRRAYRNNVPPSFVADEYGCTVKSVQMVAQRLGLRRRAKSAGWVAGL